MLIKETSLRYHDTTTLPPSRLRIDPFPLPLFPSLRVSRFIRPVRNPEIAHAHRRATSSTISDGTSSRAFLGGWISIDRPEMFSTWNLFSRLGMRDEEKEKRIIPYRIESRFLSFFSIRERIQIFEECAFPSFLLAKKKKKNEGKGMKNGWPAFTWRKFGGETIERKRDAWSERVKGTNERTGGATNEGRRGDRFLRDIPQKGWRGATMASRNKGEPVLEPRIHSCHNEGKVLSH